MKNLKKETNLSSNLVPVGLGFLVAEGKVTGTVKVIDFL